MAAEFDRKFEAMMNVIRETAAGQVGVRPNSAAGGSFSPEISGPRLFSHDSGKSVGSNAALANAATVISKGGGKASNFSRARSSSPRGDR